MSFWDDERRDAFLIANAGRLSAGQIGARLGCSRNAVIGRSHRLRISLSKSPFAPVKAAAPTSPPPAPKPAPPQPKPAPAPVIAAPGRPPCRPITIANLEPHHCCWPIGDPMADGFAYCGSPKVDARYCAEHKALGSVPMPPRRQAQHPVRRSALR